MSKKKLLQTPSQTVGPFFAYGLTPEQYNYRLASVATPELADDDTQGSRIRIEGRVFDGNGDTIPDAMIEIWQADHQGRYAHPADSRRPNSSFSGFGRTGTGTDASHRFWFHTIKPGRIDDQQAPHVNVIVWLVFVFVLYFICPGGDIMQVATEREVVKRLYCVNSVAALFMNMGLVKVFYVSLSSLQGEQRHKLPAQQSMVCQPGVTRVLRSLCILSKGWTHCVFVLYTGVHGMRYWHDSFANKEWPWDLEKSHKLRFALDACDSVSYHILSGRVLVLLLCHIHRRLHFCHASKTYQLQLRRQSSGWQTSRMKKLCNSDS